jgi:LysM repeat protein
MGFGELKEEIAAGRPVIVWVIGGVWSGSAETYTANNGKQVTVAAYEHTMIAIGYDENYVYLIDAGSGLTQTHSIANFKNSWGVLGNQAVTAKGSGSGGTTTTSSNTDTNTSGGGSSSNSGGSTYIVKSGDYLKKIADQFGMAWTELAALNNINYPWVIHVGQTLKVSGGGNQNNNPPEPTKTPKPTKVPESQGNNNSNNNNNGGSSNYTVQAGDYLASIARKLNVSWTDIADLNGLSSPYVVYAGQVLKIPGGSNNNTPQAQATPKPNSNNNESGENKNPKTYTVQKGDYLVALAREFGVNWQSIATANGIGYPWIVYPGQVITIP